jgi:hypothetical protein
MRSMLKVTPFCGGALATFNVSKAVQAYLELLLWLISQLDQFPRARRFTLGARIETGPNGSEQARFESFHGLRAGLVKHGFSLGADVPGMSYKRNGAWPKS